MKMNMQMLLLANEHTHQNQCNALAKSKQGGRGRHKEPISGSKDNFLALYLALPGVNCGLLALIVGS